VSATNSSSTEERDSAGHAIRSMTNHLSDAEVEGTLSIANAVPFVDERAQAEHDDVAGRVRRRTRVQQYLESGLLEC
jgi:hypothetical protein